MITEIGRTLVKMAKKDSNSITAAHAVGGAVGVGGLVTPVANSLMAEGAKKAWNVVKEAPFTEEEVSRLRKILKVPGDVGEGYSSPRWSVYVPRVPPALAKRLGVDQTINAGGMRYHLNTVYGDRAHPSILAHEYGHASGMLGKHPRLGLALNVLRPTGAIRALGVYPGLTAANAYNKELKRLSTGTSEDNWQDTALNVGSGIAHAGNAIMLGEEGQASLRAINAMRKLRGNKAAWQAFKKLAPAYGTYAALAANSSLLAPYIGKRVAREKWKRQQEENKE